MKNKEFDKMIEEHFDKSSVEPDKDVLNNIKTRISEYENSKPRPKLNQIWKLAISCACILVVALLSILLPILLKKDESEPQRYYAETDVEQVNLSLDYVKNYFNENYSKYNFLFDDCILDDARGIYLIGTSKLLALKLSLKKDDIPFTKIEINLVVDNNYIFNQDSFYKDGANSTIYNDYILFEKQVEEIYTIFLDVLFEYKSYKLYIQMDVIDREFFNKFL